MLDQRGIREIKVIKVIQDRKGLLDQREIKVIKVIQDRKGLVGCKDLKDRKGLLVRKDRVVQVVTSIFQI